jgi:hypothetical protein
MGVFPLDKTQSCAYPSFACPEMKARYLFIYSFIIQVIFNLEIEGHKSCGPEPASQPASLASLSCSMSPVPQLSSSKGQRPD